MTIGSFSSSAPGLQAAESDIYTDLNSLQKIKQMGRGDNTDKQQALEAVAKQFESVFLNMMMKSMREANEAFKDESMPSNEMDFYQQMFDQQLALSFSKNGVGIAEALVRQLQRQLPGSGSRDSSQGLMDLVGGLSDSMGHTNRRQIVVAGDDRGLSPSVVEAVEPEITFTSPEDFISQLLPLAKLAAKKLGVGAEAILSQAALESGWGQHVITSPEGKSSFNLFGIKASSNWSGGSAKVPTLEYEDGVAKKQTANFRAYTSYQESFDDYVEFITSNERYQLALAAADSNEGYVRQLQEAGYATDPNYADKIIDIERRYFSDTKATSIPGVEN